MGSPEDAAAKLKRIAGALRDAQTQRAIEGTAAVYLAQALQTELQNRAPRNTGAYADAIHTQMTARSGGTSVQALAPDPLSTFITQGTKAHEIVPVNARALHWSGPAGEIFAMHVNHPGTKPNPFHTEAAQAALDAARRDMGNAARGKVIDAIKNA